ncbi:phosphoglycolate phosphatase [Meinhardsimonia xiamenensis]|jgi:phosphoglycolate phosphatase|uniref:phosphoglycolate phosphatase n=1 Tax=Meinhardsimonia xiamenensis TaxID=990712 RepID=A0A1G9FA41_9RHOB|nr:HAD family hydrolase [Meinhardsimonia xiamenensis]PRX37927.1 phosphoglycolate phosphatase [Meinhardsimonia xiamenensis]SDK85269.1 phosphoglycolate phosphatase [Meinhardsimonia xiamenensis]
MRTVIFDLDGTLADTSGDLIAAANARFEALGLGRPLDPVADAATAFRGGRAMLRLGFQRVLGRVDEARVDAEYAPFLAAYAEALDTHSRLYPGAAAALEALAGEGCRLGVCTNKPEALAEELLCRLGVRGLFASLIGADTLEVRKPHPRPLLEAIARAGGERARAVLIGDTETDRATAAAAGVPAVLVTFGPEGEAVKALAPEALLRSYGELPAVVARLIGPAATSERDAQIGSDI